MIITLKGANFASSNIGTLSTWRISTVLGAGASSSNSVTSVDKESNTGYTTTITIAAGYELGAAGITVTMGGVDITSTTVSGLTITIPTKVTGNVMIKVPTKNISTGEEDDPETPVDPPSGDSSERVYTINETLKFNDMPEVAATFISESYYKATDSGNPGSKLTVEARSGYKAWKNIRVYAGQSYALNPDARAICLYDADDNAFAGFNLKNTYPDGIIPASVVTQDGWMSVTVVSSVADNDCTIKRVS